MYKGIKEVWLRGTGGNIDDLKFAYDSRVLKNRPCSSRGYGDKRIANTMEKWMDDELSASFLVVHRDTIIFEKYWRGHMLKLFQTLFLWPKQLLHG